MPPGRTDLPVPNVEEALIVYDDATQTERFVRRASFGAGTGPFGFVVPTPSRPTLGEAKEGLFEKLHELVDAPPPRAKGSRSVGGDGALPAAAVAPVQVVEDKRVAGMDATVIVATDATALIAWLAAHGFAMPEASRPWVARYIEQKWVFTAFKFVPPNNKAPMHIGAVELKFKTATPIYPYAEPTGLAANPSRRLKLWVLSDKPRSFTMMDTHQVASTIVRSHSKVVSFPERLLPGEAPRKRTLDYFVDAAASRPMVDVELPAALKATAASP